MKYNTSLRAYTSKRLEEIEWADILVGIPCYNNQKTIEHVIQMTSHGLFKYYKNLRSVIFISDGGSTDDTREVAKEFQVKPWQEKIVSIYRGPSGKGTALRSIFEAAEKLHCKACMVVDSDIRSITSDWVKYLLEPVLERSFDFVTPIYTRYKYDGTITNNIVYNLTRALYGLRLRQPIGGDFAFSINTARFFMQQEVWDTDVARFGIDIWMTTNAIVNKFKVCQSHLGIKIHDAKDPASHLAPMYRQVLTVLFTLMEKYQCYWKSIKGSKQTEIFGKPSDEVPPPIDIDLENLILKFKTGFEHFSPLWEKIFTRKSFLAIKKAYKSCNGEFTFEIEDWVKILYEISATFHQWLRNRYKLIEITTPLYYARVASFIKTTLNMSSFEAEQIVEQQAEAFENNKDYLLDIWDRKFKENNDLDVELKAV